MLKTVLKALFGALFSCLGAANAQTPNAVPLSPSQIQNSTNASIAPTIPIIALALNAVINQFDPFTNIWFDASHAQNGLLNVWSGAAWIPYVVQPANGGSGVATASANTVFAGPTTGGAAAPTFRALASGDLSISETFTGGLISVAGSPTGVGGTFALTVAGTSGGIPYFASGTTWASSAALTANQLVIGGGAGAGPAPLGSLGTATTLLHGNASGVPAFSAVTAADVTTALTTPPPIGATTPSTIGASTLTVGAPGLVGDGSTNNATALQAAVTAIASGGYIHLPCGVFKIQSAITLTIAAGKTVNIEGSGAGCTVLYFSGAINGFTFTYGLNSSVVMRGMSIVTDSTGAQTALTLTWGGPFITFGTTYIEDVTISGNNGITGTEYWGTGIADVSVANVTLDKFYYLSTNALGGTGLNVSSPLVTTAAEVINISNSDFNLSNIGIVYGAFTQGMTITNTNFQGNVGIYIPPSLSSDLDELVVTNSQFNCPEEAIGVNSPLVGIGITNTLFIIEAGATGIGFASGSSLSQATISNNNFQGVNTTSTTAIALASSSVNSGFIISTNVFEELLASVAYLSTTPSATITNNTMSNVTNALVGDPNLISFGNIPETQYLISGLPTCGTPTAGIKLFIVNGVTSPTYRGAVSTTGTTQVKVLCSNSAWVYD